MDPLRDRSEVEISSRKITPTCNSLLDVLYVMSMRFIYVVIISHLETSCPRGYPIPLYEGPWKPYDELRPLSEMLAQVGWQSGSIDRTGNYRSSVYSRASSIQYASYCCSKGNTSKQMAPPGPCPWTYAQFRDERDRWVSGGELSGKIGSALPWHSLVPLSACTGALTRLPYAHRPCISHHESDVLLGSRIIYS
ncbi:hypothetical protein BJV74DRAFT_835481 [Russula compacta]|nr:hypothetical protein BJV74DRAFT_835481 [Russula compacta]